MVLVPGGENPRHGIVPSRHSLALRLTRRNVAVPEIQALRADLTKMETLGVLGSRGPSSPSKSAFGARSYQPHIKICLPANGAPQDLSALGSRLRADLDLLRFDSYEVRAASVRGS